MRDVLTYLLGLKQSWVKGTEILNAGLAIDETGIQTSAAELENNN